MWPMINPTEETQEIQPKSEGQPEPPHVGFSVKLILGLGLLTLLLVAVLSGFSGYRSGINVRTRAEQTKVAGSLQNQFNLGMEDIAAQNWSRAQQRFEYVIRQQADFPGAAEQLTFVILQMNTTATPTPVLEPTLVPTPDLRGVEERFQNAEQLLANSDWSGTIDSLLMLRKDSPEFRTVQVDGLLYLALRNRGIDKIGKEADLEGGIYDLALAERFGPLDSEAQSYLSWARLYITGASFWEINWEEAVNYFAQIAPQLPYLRDGSGMTAIERYRLALVGLGKSRLSTKPCNAREPLETALSLAADDEVSDLLDQANRACEEGVKPNKNKKDTSQPTAEIEIPPTEIPTPSP